jgi:hypothetical protein
LAATGHLESERITRKAFAPNGLDITREIEVTARKVTTRRLRRVQSLFAHNAAQQTAGSIRISKLILFPAPSSWFALHPANDCETGDQYCEDCAERHRMHGWMKESRIGPG